MQPRGFRSQGEKPISAYPDFTLLPCLCLAYVVVMLARLCQDIAFRLFDSQAGSQEGTEVNQSDDCNTGYLEALSSLD